MVMVVILAASTAAQLAACFQAIRLIRVSQHLLAWEFLAGGFFLTLVLRLTLLFEVPLRTAPTQADLVTELLRLLMSLFLLAGVLTLEPVFRTMAEREAKLRLFRQQIDRASDPIVVLDPVSGRILDVNEASYVLSGYSREELLGLTVMDLDNDAPNLATWHEAVGRIKQAGELVREHEHQRRDGTTYPAELHAAYVRIGGRDYVVATVRDLTHRRQAEAKLRLFRELLDRTRDAIFVVAPENGQILDANQGACTLLGYSSPELLQLTIPQFVLELAPPDAWTQEMRIYRREQMRRVERTVRRRDGTTVPVEAWVSLVHWDHSDYTVAVVRDVTNRKRAERLTARHAQELARSNFDLEQFASVVSHDLGAPLSVIAGLAQVLERQPAGQLTPQARDWLQRIVREVDHMGHLIDGLLGYSRVTSWGRPLAPVDCAAAYAEAMENLQPLWEDDATVTRGELPVVKGDQVQLVQLFQNLIGNALKYRGEQPPRVHVSCERVNGNWQLCVADNGQGVEQEMAGRIFDIFQRGNCGDRPGSGLGLAICRRIVQRHGGRIWVEPNDGGGAKFYFTLPTEEEHASVLVQ
jgi:PAS domain S-box-containing protein